MAVSKYKTNQRKLILDFILTNANRHITADDVLFALKKDGHSIGKSTIYRYFDCLTAEGVLRKYSPVDGASACYEYEGNSDKCISHYHMKCDICGSLFHLECKFLNEISAHIFEHHDFKLNKSKTVFYGTCSECNKKNNGD